MHTTEYTLRLVKDQVTLNLDVPQHNIVQGPPGGNPTTGMLTIVVPQQTLTHKVDVVEDVTGILFSGFRGEKGEKGDRGADGLGGTERVNFASSDTWIINHNYGRYPIVSAYTVGGVTLMGTVVHLNTNQTNITFDEPVAGFVVIS